MTKEEWNLVERKLRETYNPANLKIDNFKVTLVLERTGVYKNAIIVYINGKIKGEWFLNDCEERRRFYPRKKKSLLSSKAKQKLFKGLTKKQKAELEAEYTYYTYGMYWTSFNSLKRHFESNNTSIELI